MGRKRVFTAGVVILTAASLLCGLAWSQATLLAARVVQGAAAAIMTPAALPVISATFTEGSERNKALGIGRTWRRRRLRRCPRSMTGNVAPVAAGVRGADLD